MEQAEIRVLLLVANNESKYSGVKTMLKHIHKLSAGFTLVEILVALLIISVGLLGVATLQVRGQQFNQVAYFRTQATLLAYDIMDRIRINSDFPPNDEVVNGDDGSYKEPNFTDTGPGGTGRDDKCDIEPCDEQQLRDYDLNNWFNSVRETLPAGEANIVWQNNPRQYTITIRWKNIVDGKPDSQEEQEWTLPL